jgi:DNA-binding NtrC family response regulator
MGGNEAFQLMRGIDPMLKGIVSSGYSHDTVMSNYRDYGFIAVLKKPYNIDEIGEVIASVMAG